MQTYTNRKHKIGIYKKQKATLHVWLHEDKGHRILMNPLVKSVQIWGLGRKGGIFFLMFTSCLYYRMPNRVSFFLSRLMNFKENTIRGLVLLKGIG